MYALNYNSAGWKLCVYWHIVASNFIEFVFRYYYIGFEIVW